VTKLRKGDLVTFTAIVSDVGDYDNGEQQIMAQILPKGKTIGWCLQKENAFKPAEFKLRVGDRVAYNNRGAGDTYEVLFLTEHQATIKKVGNWTAEMASLQHLRRL
jgi:plastocyanin